MAGHFDEEDLHEIASHGSASLILSIIDGIKMSASVVPDERVASSLNRKNEAKYTPLHCAIFGR